MSLTLHQLRSAVAKMKGKELKPDDDGNFLGQIRNWPLFRKLKKAGKIYEVKPGVWELK